MGTLGGPLGLLLGGSYGALLGSLGDLDTAEQEESVFATMARAIKPGTTALIAAVTEPAVDGEMERLGGVVVRRAVADVEAEIAAAEDAARAADEEARRKLREERKAKRKEKVQQKVDELKAKLGGNWVCPVSTDSLPLGYSTSSQANLFVL